MNTILLKKSDFIAPDRVILSDYRFEHMQKVLKSQVGSSCKVGLLNDKLGKGEVVVINGHRATNEEMAYLLKYDSVHGRFPGKVQATENGLKIDDILFEIETKNRKEIVNEGKI